MTIFKPIDFCYFVGLQEQRLQNWKTIEIQKSHIFYLEKGSFRFMVDKGFTDRYRTIIDVKPQTLLNPKCKTSSLGKTGLSS